MSSKLVVARAKRANVNFKFFDCRYTIVQPPQFGKIEKLRAVDNSWIAVDSFTSDQILLGHIRYIHNIDFPVHDDFKVSQLAILD